MQKTAFGNGYGLNRNTGGASTLTTAIPAMKGVTRNPGTNIMPGSPKTGAAKPKAKGK